ncbi:hypothetical protein L798_09498 [Zootermopsis nevadensis]|uniref:Uncharacterized protein n=1 Tax=Zootermopsis nevadensis TaxID=136037 RepID=A0A067RCY3_ZOONE|nr:hypothetical protein L798_09498 [Zootermopsis nevadensis]
MVSMGTLGTLTVQVLPPAPTQHPCPSTTPPKLPPLKLPTSPLMALLLLQPRLHQIMVLMVVSMVELMTVLLHMAALTLVLLHMEVLMLVPLHSWCPCIWRTLRRSTRYCERCTC